MIWNKKRQYNVRVIDLADNVIYEEPMSRLLLEILTRLDFSRMQTKRFESALYMSQAQSQITELMEQAPIMVKQLRRKNVPANSCRANASAANQDGNWRSGSESQRNV